MDTPNKDNYKKRIFAAFCVLLFSFNGFALQKRPDPAKPTAETFETISGLNRDLALCTDNSLTFSIEYKIAITYFKADDSAQALDAFNKLAQSKHCPDLIKLCSLNMTGLIYRMQAEDDKALNAYNELVKLSEKFTTNDPNSQPPASVLKLTASANFSRAEIYQYNQDYKSSIAEYEKIIALLKSAQTTEANTYIPLALDRISQLYLIEDDIEDYSQAAAELVKNYPEYYRTGIVKMETEAVKILKEKDSSVNFSQGSFAAPAKLIALIKASSNKELKDKAAVLLKDLTSQYRQNYSAILIGYHYACLLDAIEKKQQAVEVLKNICEQSAAINSDTPAANSTIPTLADYAKLQQAIILGEDNNYKQAIEIISSLETDPNNAHILNLSDSIKKALETLKREVPKDVNAQ